MHDRTRNRLIGIIVILLVIIVFFPYMGRKDALQLDKELPLTVIASSPPTHNNTATAIDSVKITPEKLTTVAGEQRTALSKKPEKERQEAGVVESVLSAKEKPPILQEKYYTIQLVALKNAQKIEELLALLRLHNYQTYIHSPDLGSDKIIRLFVGPYPSREQAESTIIDLNNLTKLKGIVVTK